MSLGLFALMGGLGAWLMLGNNKKTQDSELKTPSELKNLMGKGVTLSQNVRLSPEMSNEHIAIIAPSGQGKSRKVIMPSINNLSTEKCTIIATDPKGELYEECKRGNKKVIIFNPYSDDSVGYDPLFNCKDTTEVRQICSQILNAGLITEEKAKGSDGGSKNAEWIAMAMPLMNAYMIMNYYTKKYSFDEAIENILTMPLEPYNKRVSKEEYLRNKIVNEFHKAGKLDISQYNSFSELPNDLQQAIKTNVQKLIEREKEECRQNSEEYIPFAEVLVSDGTIAKEIMDSGIKEAIYEFKSFMTVKDAQQTLACIRNTLNICLKLFRDYNVSKLVRKPSIDFTKLRKEETILYIQIPERYANYFAPLTNVFITQMLDRLLDDKKGLQTYILFDEFVNVIGFLGDSLTQLLSTCRSRRVSITACIQSINQLYDTYGSKGKTIIELFKTHLYMAGHKIDTAEYASSLCGTHKVKKDKIETIEKVMTPDGIMRMDRNKALIVTSNKNPIVDDLFAK